MDTNDILSSRPFGEVVPITFGTAAAIEKINNISSMGIDALLVNVTTLFRNLYSSLDAKNKIYLTDTQLAQEIYTEMERIHDVVSRHYNNRVQVVFYHCTHKRLPTRLKYATFRKNNTDLQKQYALIQDNVVKLLLENTGDLIKVFDYDIAVDAQQVYVVTHIIADLLSARNYRRMLLIESYTGTIKLKSEWYTKLVGGKDLSPIPFNGFTLSVFGDPVLVAPMNIKVKRYVLTMAKDEKWTGLTTKDKVTFGLDKSRDRYSAETVKQYLSSW